MKKKLAEKQSDGSYINTKDGIEYWKSSQLPPTSFIDFNGYNVTIGSNYYPIDKKTFKIYEPFTAHEKTKEQLSNDCFYFASLTSAQEFVKERLHLDKEFSRYKQDCRKRALDLAHGERERYYLNGSNSLVNQNPVPKIDADFILKQADKYYQWLIEIPQ